MSNLQRTNPGSNIVVGKPRELPHVIGLCQDLSHADEFYMPNPKPGETCPWCDLKLIHFKRTTYRLERP